MRQSWGHVAVLVVLSGAAGWVAAVGPAVWLVGVWIGVAYVAGRYMEARQWMELEKVRVRASLEAFTSWAEHALASAPEELDEETEAVRQRLQADYQAAQAALEKLRD